MSVIAKIQRANSQPDARPSRSARNDMLALAIAVTATCMVAAIGGKALSQVWARASGIGLGPDQLLTNALLLNIALVIFGWRRYQDLHGEVVARRQAEDLARQMEQTDPLTGCLNRHSFAPRANQLLATLRERGETAALVMLDINDFKVINDKIGTAGGDLLLTDTAQRIEALLPPEALLARLGGDEFACVIPFTPGHPERVDHIADAMLATMDRKLENHRLSASVGLASGDRQNRLGNAPIDANGLLHLAEVALFHAKKQARPAPLWFEESLETELRYRCELELAIREAIPAGEFVPYYEQQVDLATGEVLGFEMLARWHSPTFGLIGPDVFIPIAEEIGVIAEMSESLIRQALRDAREWHPRLTLSVNISPLQLRDPWFAQKLLKLLVEAQFPPQRLEVEITETSLHQNIAVVQALVTSLRNQGITISLDDFGTGYSSFAQLRKLPFDRIKIDRSFVLAMQEDSDSRTIVETIALLGKGLGLPITAEGVESTELLESLQSLGSFKGQGYLYGKPQDAQATREFLAERALLAPHAHDVSLASSRQAEPAPSTQPSTVPQEWLRTA
ncbi:diguanylate cyclase (GGDEF)-like protein [Novosphingobium sp. SG751A]|uniref:putative bifunctional diguanylate cyclase/phosphodiesterase n=1 Tax=Novosphingobium sp. SG751A TaxID=2587000 RepID=UPI0015533C99|nr:EAL domain-containing protein [Novosphingobium sp. SG751A]NOW44251.1 diguanylate cyclase (GGDEF)-like protein [Novosphingobium sp. SG751A]